MSKRSRTLAINSGALLAIQLANYALPFILIPYLTRTLGTSLYGVVAFGLALIQLACVITDYGFNLSATYKIAKNSEDKLEQRNIVTAVTVCKIALLLPVSILLGIYIFLDSKYDDHQLFFWLLLFPIIGQTIQPTWFFQGIERMAFITACTILSRILYAALIVLFVSDAKYYYWVAIAQGIANISASAMGTYLILRLGYWPRWCGWKYIQTTFLESTNFFWSRAAVATYTTGSTVFLGLALTPIHVAYYSAAEQIYKAGYLLMGSLSQALYPYMAREKNFSLLKKILKGSCAIGALSVITCALIGQPVLSIIYGENFSPAYPTLIVFSFVFMISAPSILLGYPFLGAIGKLGIANRSVIWAGGVQVIAIASIYLFNSVSEFSIALAILSAELFVLIYRAKFAMNFKSKNQEIRDHT